jgi:hypothetical protein
LIHDRAGPPIVGDLLARDQAKLEIDNPAVLLRAIEELPDQAGHSRYVSLTSPGLTTLSTGPLVWGRHGNVHRRAHPGLDGAAW